MTEHRVRCWIDCIDDEGTIWARRDDCQRPHSFELLRSLLGVEPVEGMIFDLITRVEVVTETWTQDEIDAAQSRGRELAEALA